MVLVKCFSGMASLPVKFLTLKPGKVLLVHFPVVILFFILMRTEENAAEITRQLQRYTVRHT